MLELKTESSVEAVDSKTSRASDEVRAQLQQQANMMGQEERKEGRMKKMAVSAEPVDEKSAKVKLTHHDKPAGFVPCRSCFFMFSEIRHIRRAVKIEGRIRCHISAG